MWNLCGSSGLSHKFRIIFSCFLDMRIKKWKDSKATLVGALTPPVPPIYLNSNRVNRMIHGLFVLSAVRVEQVGVTRGPIVPISVACSRPFFPHDDAHP
ncbi:hypothetical protein Y032_0901g2955 [Ancylostoma ceylanicum]|uniref:Uncharacterized protein n=1 Tax=Ancylostoma ceylanicum TaxID=53326 RepID=A0A016W955_9BILA|nr:hypothetical protein Y032_0901g2955 [Ancylostoma ceylanicum]